MLAYLSLGSNLGDREQNLRRAIGELKGVTKVSSFHETEPLDMAPGTPMFLNCAVEIETGDTPEVLLRTVLDIERRLGRVRENRSGSTYDSRTIDIDILFYGDQVVSTPDLTIPHPRLLSREFVLRPLAEIAPNLRHPVTGKTL